jgi:hypothetical protein
VITVGCCLLTRSRLVLGRYHPSQHLVAGLAAGAEQLRAIEARIRQPIPDAPPVG